ncbi:hypothetical protein JMF89_03860 [Clostridiaceae bacterium UIB06]|uniref:DUF4179 domain-containing protein n=1 Tax=Clostridium thailandense TaxID=2794346 RepID=A0A949TGA6_9CLOT|nr:hypothetical protein [Clostridium thailandense]MBV7271680.1 hypothetical protein [Clostridium thailandense]MCH5136349.1 hypothetical protein [Clostridiaceae bacterium UIB06]
MKFKKKTAMILSFAVGTLMFASTAMAEVASKNGYDQVKDSLKYTAESCTTKLSNYTMDVSLVMKDNGNTIASNSSVIKCSVSDQATERTETTIEGSTKREYYNYSDKNSFINKDNSQNVYYVNEYEKPHENNSFKNPFKEKQASDVEKIADALIGNLKDSVAVTQNADGSKELSGSLNESQIPALVNAVVSFQSKNVFGRNRGDNEDYMPKISKDIFVKDVTGKMLIDKNGLIQSVLGTGTISGKDESGKEHILTFELLGKLSNINSTIVKKPDLSGQKVEKVIEKDYNRLSNPEKYTGKYKSDIILEKDGKFEKIGERSINIEQINEKSISGTYHEEYTKGYEDYAYNKTDFKFSASFNKDHFDAPFTSSDSSIKGNISVNPHSARIYFNIDSRRNQNLVSDDEFNKVFN